MSRERTTETHPSYGSLQIVRVQGRTTLFRSSMEHDHYISMRVRHAEVHLDGVHESVNPIDKDIVEIIMSETQFARAITSMNMGVGAPVTIAKIQGECIAPPLVEDRKRKVVEGHDKYLDNHEAGIREAARTLEKLRAAKKRPTLKEMGELIRALNCQVDNFRVNGDYYREEFARDMEGIVDEARTEIEAHVLATQNKVFPKVIEGPAKPQAKPGRCDHPCPAPMCGPEWCKEHPKR